jgi:hypothetical protein
MHDAAQGTFDDPEYQYAPTGRALQVRRNFDNITPRFDSNPLVALNRYFATGGIA